MNSLAARRRHPAATVVVLVLALLTTGLLYSALASPRAEASTTASQSSIDDGRALFAANCSSCHGLQAQGSGVAPSLIGVGAASVDFQVGTGRMPLKADSAQAPEKEPQHTPEEVAALAAYVASLAPGPAIPPEELTVPLDERERIAEGNEIFRTNCAMCHNVVGAGGALTRGKYAPSLEGTTGAYIYEAMQTGPQSMPVFSDANITPEQKQSIISYISAAQSEPSPGGLNLGGIGPVAEGLFAWAAALVALIACALWLARRAS